MHQKSWLPAVPAFRRRIVGSPPAIFSVFAVLLFAATGVAAGGEVVRYFASDITIRPDGTLAVSETIRVLVEGDRIRHGIVRELPAHPGVEYRMISADMDGVDVSGRGLRRSAGGAGFVLGDEGVLLAPGEHTFTLSYETSGGLNFPDDHCEFAWNVAGAGWDFVIEEATCRIAVPEDAVGITDAMGWLGRPGVSDSPVSVSRPGSNVVLFVAEKEILPGEDFTVAVRFPRHLADGSGHRGAARAILVVVLTLGYFLVTWLIWGRDPPAGVIIPLFHPPEAGYYGGKKGWSGARKGVMSAAAASYVKNAAYLDSKGFASVFVSLAARGLCEIRKTRPGDYSVIPRRSTKPKFGPLPEEEFAAYEELLRASGADREFPLTETNANTIQRIHDKVVSVLSKRYAVLWAQNLWIQALGWLVVLPAGIVGLNSEGGDFFERLLPMLGMAAVFYLIHRQVACFWSRSINSYSSAGVALTIVSIIAFFALRLRAISLTLSGLWLLFYRVEAINVATIALVVIPMFFCPVMKAPSRTGRALLDKVDGLLLYIKTAERDRLKALHPPEETPETFERILPYAVAFGLEKTWTARFTAKLGFDTPLKADRDFSHDGRNLGRLFRGGAGAVSFARSLARSSRPLAMARGGSFFGGGRIGGGAGSGGGGGGGGGW